METEGPYALRARLEATRVNRIERVFEAMPELRALAGDEVSELIAGENSRSVSTHQLAQLAADLVVEHRPDTPFGDLLPLLTDIPTDGPVPRELPKRVATPVIRNTDLRWRALAGLTINETLQWPAFGRGRAALLFAFLLDRCLTQPTDQTPAGEVTPAPTDEQILSSLRVLCAWAAARFGDSNLSDALGRLTEASDEADLPNDALIVLHAVSSADFPREEDHRRFDPWKSADSLLGEFDERDSAILERILHVRDGAAATLASLGARFGITREAIRLRERRISGRLVSLTRRPEYASVRARVEAMTSEIGLACPITRIPIELVNDDTTLRDELFVWLGGYRFVGDWLLHREIIPLEENLRRLFTEAALHEVATIDGFTDGLVEFGVRREHAKKLIESVPQFRCIGDSVLLWEGSIGDKAERILRHREIPCSPEELHNLAGRERSVNSLKNALGSEPRFRRVGLNRFGLAEWPIEEYEGIVPEMIAAIRSGGGLVPIQQLGDRLSEDFGVSSKSVGIHAMTNPAFVKDGESVRLRREDEPYITKKPLELTGGCFVVDGAWAFCLEVDDNVLRGSSMSIPESFAVHLGLLPLTKGVVSDGERPIKLSWTHRPSIGSLRAVADRLGATSGDKLFVIRQHKASLAFRIVRVAELESASIADRLLLLTGADAGDDQLAAKLGEALGLGGAVLPSLRQIRARFDDRREHELLALFDAVERQRGSELPR